VPEEQRILDKSFEMIVKLGIRSVTMDDISSQLGISKKTLYQFVSNKAALIEKVFAQQIEREKSFLEESSLDASDPIEELFMLVKFRIDALTRMSPVTIFDLKKYYRTTWKQLKELHRKHMLEVILKNLEKGKSVGLYRSDFNEQVIGRLYLGQTFALVDESIFPKHKIDLKEAIIEFIHYHLRGICTEAGLKRLEVYFNKYTI
jgi:AcrR family transcriptional regulator